MRYSLLAAALAVAMGSTSFSASAADNRDQTIAELKAQLEALTAKVAELEERSDAQSDVNIDTAAQLDKLTTGTTVVDTKGGIKVTAANQSAENGHMLIDGNDIALFKIAFVPLIVKMKDD